MPERGVVTFFQKLVMGVRAVADGFACDVGWNSAEA